jgi:hypothetical protein
MATIQDLIVQYAPSEYHTADIQPDATKQPDATPEWAEPFEWSIGGTLVSVEKAVVIPVTLTDSDNQTTSNYIVVGYVGAGGS